VRRSLASSCLLAGTPLGACFPSRRCPWSFLSRALRFLLLRSYVIFRIRPDMYCVLALSPLQICEFLIWPLGSYLSHIYPCRGIMFSTGPLFPFNVVRSLCIQRWHVNFSVASCRPLQTSVTPLGLFFSTKQLVTFTTTNKNRTNYTWSIIKVQQKNMHLQH